MKQQRWSRFLMAATALALAVAGLEAAERPNIVLILADDLGWSDLGCYGGEIVHDLGHFIDLMPTFLELAGAEYPAALGKRKPLPLDGRSLAPVFCGQTPGTRDFLAWRVPQHRVLRAGDWKIVSKDEKSPWELYNLARDGTETTDLAAKHSDVVRQTAARWQAWDDSCHARR